MKTNNKKLIWGIVIVVVVIVAGYCFYKNSGFFGAMPEVLDTTNWKTYTNDKYGFELKHPSNWYPFPSKESGGIYFVRDESEHIVFDVYVLDSSIQEAEKEILFIEQINKVDSREKVNVNGLEWEKVIGQNNDIVQMTSYNGKTYAIHYSSKEPFVLEVISTLKFTSPTSQNSNQNKTNWGVSYTIPTGWKITNNVDNQVVLTQDSSGDRIILDYTESQMYTDIDAKFGKVTYQFNDVAQKWQQVRDSESGTGQTLSDATPAFYIQNVIPVFKGTSRWKTYIVAISDDKFLRINITGSGNTAPLDDFIKSVKINS